MQGVWDSIVGWGRDSFSDFAMVKLYIGCAIAGGTVLLGQTGLSLFGIGGDTEVDPDVSVDDLGGADSLHFLSIRALAGFLTFFGLVGWGGNAAGWNPVATIGAATAAGSTVMVFVAFMMRFFIRMQSSGNMVSANAIGRTARVYLRIPDHKSGKGKITVSVQGRTVEYQALTAGDELPTGSECRILAQLTEDTFEVGPL